MDIDKSKLVLINETEQRIVDQPLETKEIGYYKDAWNRFKKNKASLVAFIIICILFFFVIFGPYFKKYDYKRLGETEGVKMQYLPPRVKGLEKLGIFNGHKKITKGKKFLVDLYNTPGIGKKTILNMPKELQDDDPSNDGKYANVSSLTVKVNMYYYTQYINSYRNEANELVTRKITRDDYEKLLKEGKILELVAVNPEKTQYEVRLDFFKFAFDQTPEDTYFWFGTDSSGRDLFTMLWQGARISLAMALSIVIINSIIGITIGAISGYYGGTFDLLFDRFVEILSSIPFLAVLTLLIIRFGTTVGIIILAFTVTGWIGSYQMSRMQFYRYKNREYILAARTLGASDARIMFKHIFPNAIGYMVTSFALSIPNFVFTEATYSYLKIINYSNATSVGLLLEQGQAVMQTQPHLLLFPAIYIALLMITFNLFGNGLRDAFNPSLRGAE